MKYLLIAVVAIMTVSACSNESGSANVTESGYQYEMLYDADGALPNPGDNVFVHTTVRAADTVLFDSRENPGKPSPVKLPEGDQAVRGNLAPVQDVLQYAGVGDSIRLIYPVDSFQTIPPILQPYSEVYYDMKVTDVMSADQYETWRQEDRERANQKATAIKGREVEVAAMVQQTYEDYKAGKLDDQIVRTDSGLGYVLHEEGTPGTALPKGEIVKAHYYGILSETGKVFDNSFRRGMTYDFNVGLGGVIAGWDEAFQLLNKGAKATLFVPANLAYGEGGFGSDIPPNSELIFYVENTDDEE